MKTALRNRLDGRPVSLKNHSMRAITFFYLKLFLCMSVSFGLTMGVLFGIAMGSTLGGRSDALEIGLKAGFFMLLSGPAFGWVCALLLGTYQIWKVAKQDLGVSPETLKVNQEQRLIIDQPSGEVGETCRRALETIPRHRILAQDPTTLSAKCQAGWGRIANRVRVVIEREGADSCRVTINSKPGLRTVMVDGGDNLRNVQAIAVYLHQHCKVREETS